MVSVPIIIKWAGKKYDVEVDINQPAGVFKQKLYELTGVPAERQKVMIKGGMLKDDTDLSTLKLKPKQTIMMMGTAGELPKEPVKKTLFEEDMTEEQLAEAYKVPSGLVNLGNTCYMNATLQCMRAIPELQEQLNTITDSIGTDTHKNLAITLRDLYQKLANSSNAFTPLVFLQTLRAAFPQFAERGAHGFLQQDAEECWGQLVTSLKDCTPGRTIEGQTDPSKSFVDQYLKGEFTSEIVCDEDPEDKSVTTESFLKLPVNISSGISTYMLSEIENSLTQQIEKFSEKLNKQAMYTKKSKISRLPSYITINFIRFQWKQTEQIRAKILKRVKFPMDLDMTPYCTPELQEKLKVGKAKIKEMQDKELEKKKREKALKENPLIAKDEDVKMEDSSKEPKKQYEIYRDLNIDNSLIEDVGANVSGQYDLVAVLTHMGRNADSGHYIGWVRQETTDNWWKFDDDKVTAITSEDIPKLEGGGDWHTAYICLYKAKELKE